MAKPYTTALFIFRRDLRLHDNTGLMHALKDAKRVYPLFIFTPEQVENNQFKSNNAIQFMIESLQDLHEQLTAKGSLLNLFYGENESVLSRLMKIKKIQAIYVNKDYTKFSKKRDKKIQALCRKHAIDFYSFDDVCLHPVKSITTKQGNCYLKFTPYFKGASTYPVAQPKQNRYKNYAKTPLRNTITLSQAKKRFCTSNPHLIINGGTHNAMKLLRTIKAFKKYNTTRNFPSIPTTLLSAHNKFGTVSIRQVYHAIRSKLGAHTDLIRQLYWRDFYYNLMDTFPNLLKQSLKPKYDAIKWKKNKHLLNAWKEGMTGFPLIDAGMRQMNTTGFMHNRARLVVASLLCKVLLIDWRVGEKYFAQTLLDYDPAQNNGNWAWVSGAGADAQPYFRIFNPFLQSKRYDPECVYIKQWISELQNIPNNHIHKWDKYSYEYDVDYPPPIVDYKEQKEEALALYQKVLRQ